MMTFEANLGYWGHGEKVVEVSLMFSSECGGNGWVDG